MDPRATTPWEIFMSGAFIGFIVGAMYVVLVLIISESLK